MKTQLKPLLFFLWTVLISFIFNSCENENFEQISQESITNQEKEQVEIELNGKPITVEKIGKEYRLGDMIIHVDQTTDNKAVGRVGKRWPNNTVTYVLDPSLTAVNVILDAIFYWELFTDIEFVEKEYTGDFADLKGTLLFFKGIGCGASVGYLGADIEHNVSIGNGCDLGDAIHEIGHAVGLWHEQSRLDRDEYVQIHWENIIPGTEHNFQTYVENNSDGSEYTAFDFNSVMLYGSFIFSANDEPTITRLDGSLIDRQDENLSYLDLQGLEIMYPSVGQNTKISISHNAGDVYVSSENGGDIVSNREAVGEWEKFEVIPYGDGYVYLKGNNDKFLSEGAMGDFVRFDMDEIEDATKLRLERSGDFYGLQSEKSGLYLGREFSEDKLIFSESYFNAVSAFKIQLIENVIENFSEVGIKGDNGKYVSSENGKKSMNCNRPAIGVWEKFGLINVEGDIYALRGNNGMYMSSEDGRKPINCNRPAIGDWEKFELIRLGGDTYALKGSNGKYVSSENGTVSMTCNKSSIGSSEEFTITGI